MLQKFSNVIDFLKQEGAEYADIRVHMEDLTESISIMNGSVDNYNFEDKQGYGIRVLCNGAWGFASSEDLSENHIKTTAKIAMDNAKSASKLIKERVSLAPKKVVEASYETPRGKDPFDVPLQEKVNYLMKLNNELKHEKFGFYATAANFYRRKIYYWDTEGAHIFKNLLDVDKDY